MAKLFSQEKKEKKKAPIEVTVAEIHDEFDTAQEEFLKQVQNLLKKTEKKDLQDVTSLKRLGFFMSANVKQYENLIENEKEARMVEMCMYEYSCYPYKFITDKVLKRICEKYGLVIGRPSDFIGEIPKKNVDEILASEKIIQRKHLKRVVRHDYLSASASYLTSQPLSRQRFHFDPDQELSADSLRRQAEYIQQQNKLYQELSVARDPYSDRPYQPTYLVVGTLDQFNLQRKVITDYVIKEQDPVVLVEVEGGYLIVSKWGPEASIKEIHNESEN